MPEAKQPGALHITSVQIENVKSVKAFYLTPSPRGLTIVGGKNKQGKTSVLDAVAWALGGKKYEPSQAQRNGSVSNPEIRLTLSNGIKVERKGKNSALTVIDPSGQKSGQTLLDSFVSQFALDLPKFINASPKEKAQTLLQVLGIGDELTKLDQEEQRLYNERHAVGQNATAKKKHAEELPEYPDAPAESVSVSALLKEQQEILARNGENQKKRAAVEQYQQHLAQAEARVKELESQLEQARAAAAQALMDVQTASQSAQDLEDQSTAELEKQIADYEAINTQVAANKQKQAAADEAEQYQAQYDGLSKQIEDLRDKRLALLNSAPLPLPGLSVENAELIYNSQQWDCMSASEQLRVAVAIVRALKPDCSFVLMDKLEQMDLETLKEFGAWLESEGLQVIATRVSTGDECSIIIEDGLPAGKSYSDVIANLEAKPEPAAGSAMDW